MLTGINLIAPKVLTSMTQIVTDGLTEESLKTIWLLAAALFGLYLLRILFRYLSNYMSHKGAWELVEKLRIQVYAHIQSYSMGYFKMHKTGDLMSRVVNDTGTFELIFAHIMPEMVTNLVTLVGVTIILFTTNATLALFTCIPIPFILIAGQFFVKRVQPNFRAMQKSLADLNVQLQDNFSGIEEIQAFNQQQREENAVAGKARGFTDAMLRALNLSAVFHPGVEFITSLGTVIVVGFGGYLAYRMQLSVADIVGFILYLSLFYAPITGLARLLEDVQHALAGAERVLEILDTPTDIYDAPDALQLTGASGHVAFNDICFGYQEGIEVLENVTLQAKPGQMIAIVGPTGAGKSTLVHLIGRFYDPSSGSVTIDGHDVRGIALKSLRDNIAWVQQDTFLFNGSIAENIAYAKPDAPMEDIIAAAKIARIHEEILSMSQGYETQVGERGARLSGGQKQRIAIARAVLRNSSILIMDEATASVDVATEVQIQNAIQELAGTRTIFAIAHRLSTVRRADIILVLSGGSIVQRGTHKQLLNEEGLYSDLWLAQDREDRAAMEMRA